MIQGLLSRSLGKWRCGPNGKGVALGKGVVLIETSPFPACPGRSPPPPGTRCVPVHHSESWQYGQAFHALT